MLVHAVIPAFERLRQGDLEHEASLGYRMSSRYVRVTQVNPNLVSKPETKQGSRQAPNQQKMQGRGQAG